MLIILLLNLTIPADFPINDYYEYLQVRGYTEQNFVRPNNIDFITGQINDLLINDWTWKPIDRRIIGYFRRLITKTGSFSYLLGLNGHYSIDNLYGGYADIRTAGRLNNVITYSQALRITRANIIDSTGPYPWKNLQAYINEGLVIIEPGMIRWEIGRRNLNLSWSGDNSLMLSGTSEGHDGILMAINGSYYEFHSFFGILNAVENRFITLHRLALRIKNVINIGFSEALLFSGEFEPLYASPFVPYYLAQWGMRRDDNIMWLFDARVHMLRSYFSAELLIDDYMYENDPYPDKLAYRLQLKSFPFYPVMIKAGYTMVDKWVYTQRDPQNVYQNKGIPLGFPLGNDVDQSTVTIKYFTGMNVHPSVNLDFIRKGEGSIFLPYEEEGGGWQPPFPSGIVTEQLKIYVGVDIFLLRTFFLRSDIGYEWLRNTDHQAGNNSEDLIFNAKIWLIL